MNIGEKIAILRKENHLTQEQLAKAIGVSVPAVSKWEHGVTSPDISILTPLARMLHTDVNDLLSFQKDLTEKEVDALIGEIQKICIEKGYQAGMVKAFEFLKEYPNDPYLKLKTANAVTMYAYTAKDDEENFQEWMDKSTELFEEICQEKGPPDDSSIKKAAIVGLSSRYMQKSRWKEAEQLLKNLPNEAEMHYTKHMLSRIYLEQGKTADARKKMKEMQVEDLMSLLADIRILFDISVKEDNMEEALHHARKYYQIRKAMPILIWCHPSELLVEAYLLMDDLEHAMEHFSDFIDEIIEMEQSSLEGSDIFRDYHVMSRVVINNPFYQPLFEKPEGKEKIKELLAAMEENQRCRITKEEV